jgi:hypothetical protein
MEEKHSSHEFFKVVVGIGTTDPNSGETPDPGVPIWFFSCMDVGRIGATVSHYTKFNKTGFSLN